MTLANTIVQNAVGSIVGTVVGITVGLIYKRFLRRENERVERLIHTVEEIIGVAIMIPQPKGTHTMNAIQALLNRLSRQSKALLGAAIVALVSTAEWFVNSPDTSTAVQSVVPTPFNQFVPLALGGLATVIAHQAIYWKKNAEALIDQNQVDEPATAPAAPVVAAAPRVPAQLAHLAYEAADTTEKAFWTGVTASAQTSPTAIVQLQPIPQASAL